MKTIMKWTYSQSEKLPLEYPMGQTSKIYGMRLLLFSVVVVANLILLGIILILLRSPGLSLLIVVAAFLIPFILLYVRRRLIGRVHSQQDDITLGWQQLQEEVFAEIQKSGNMDSEEFYDAMIILRMKSDEDLEGEAVGFSSEAYSLQAEVIEFLKGIKRLPYPSRILSNR